MNTQYLQYVREQLMAATADLNGATKGQLEAWQEHAQFDTGTYKRKKPHILDVVTGKMITLDNTPTSGKQSYAKGSSIALVSPVEFSTSSWRRAVLSLDEHQKAWLLWCYSESVRWGHQVTITQWAWSEFKDLLSNRKIAGKTLDRLKTLIWLAAQDVKSELAGREAYEYQTLASLVGVTTKNWSETFTERWVAMKHIFLQLDSDALLLVTRTRSKQKAAFLQMICKLVPDFNASEANNTLYSGIIGRLGVSAKAGGEAASLLGIVSEQAQEGWIRIPELSTRRAILNLTGIWMQDYCPANTGVEDVYYADGWYYINEVSFAETLTKGYLPKGQNGSGYTFFDSYDAPTGMMDGAVTVLLSESDNDYGIAAQVRSSEKITDGRYINVYESVEERELSESIKDIWMTESASYQFDNYSRILTVQSLVSPDAGIDTHFRYSCKPGEDDGTFTMEWKGMDEANIDQVRTFTVSVDEETQAMKLTDAQTQEEITLNSIAQQANQPTMSGQ